MAPNRTQLTALTAGAATLVVTFGLGHLSSASPKHAPVGIDDIRSSAPSGAMVVIPQQTVTSPYKDYFLLQAVVVYGEDQTSRLFATYRQGDKEVIFRYTQDKLANDFNNYQGLERFETTFPQQEIAALSTGLYNGAFIVPLEHAPSQSLVKSTSASISPSKPAPFLDFLALENLAKKMR